MSTYFIGNRISTLFVCCHLKQFTPKRSCLNKISEVHFYIKQEILDFDRLEHRSNDAMPGSLTVKRKRDKEREG